MGKCPLCGESTNKPSTRLIKESCGHSKCRFCLINEESGCSICEGNNGVSCRLESIGNFDYHLPTTTIPSYEELHSSPRKLDFNKIPDDFNDCPLDGGKLTIDNSINQNSDNVVANISGPKKVDIGTETENIARDRDVQSQIVPENTHSFLTQVTQTPVQPVTKVPEGFADAVSNNHQTHQETPIQSVTKLSEVFPNTISNNYQPHQETPVVQNTNFIPVAQRADGRQYITIAFIANNSPNKNQQIVTPVLNQCLPTLASMTAVQRTGGNQCIPMLGNISALQNGNQLIIRSSNIVQNIMGNQSMPVVGNLNTIQNLPGNQSLNIVGNVNAVKNLVANQSLSPLPPISPLQTPSKGQSLPTTVSADASHQKVVGNHPHQVTQVVPKEVEKQSAPIQENANTTRKQVRTRGLPRIKTVKNVNIAQKSATNQSDKVNSQVDKSPVQAVKGKRRRKELPVYLIPRKPNEQKKSPPVKNPPSQVIGCMSPRYQLEDYLLFNKQQKASEAKDLEIQSKTINYTQMINKPPESVINETPSVSDQFNNTIIEDKFIENKVGVTEHEGEVPNSETNDDKKSTKDISIETDECKERQDLSVIFNIRDENKQTLNEKIEEEKETIEIPNVESSNKDEYQNLDVLFDIIEKESEKLNGGMFDKEEKSILDKRNDFDYEEKQKLNDSADNGKDADNMLDQEDNIEKEKDQNFNNGTDEKHSKDQHLNLDMDSQNNEIENLNEEISSNEEENRNSNDIIYEQEQNVVAEHPIHNSAIELLDRESGCKEIKHHNFDTEIKDHLEESEILDNVTDSSFENNEVDNEEVIQSLDEKSVTIEKESENQVDEEAFLQEKNDQHFDEKIGTEELVSDENDVSDGENNSQCIIEKSDNEETNDETHYEYISNRETDSKELNNENQEFQIPTAENHDEQVNYEHSNENTVEAERHISNRVNQHEETSQSLKIETQKEVIESSPLEQELEIPTTENNDEQVNYEHLHENTVEAESQSLNSDQHKETNGSHEEIIASATLDTDNDLPICETNDSDNSTLDATHQKKLGIVKKPRGRPKKSLSNYKHAYKSGISYENKKLVALKKHSDDLNTEVDANEEDESFALKVHIDEDEITHGNINTNSTLAETEKPDDTTESALSMIKQRRGRKKKSFSDYELGKKPSVLLSNKNNQLIVKKPRGRPKKSLSNVEQSSKPEVSQEIQQPVEKKLTSFNLENTDHEGSLDQSFEEEGQVLEVNVQIHSQKIHNNSTLNIHDKKERINSESNLASVIQKAWDRTKTKNVLHNNEKESLQSDVDAISTFVDEEEDEKDETPIKKPDTVNENNEQSSVIEKSRGRPKKSMNTSEQPSKSDPSNVNIEPAVKKSRGRPKKSLTNIEQHNETGILNIRESINDEKSKEQHEDKESQVLDKEDLSQNKTSQERNDGEKESLQLDNTTYISSNDLENRKSIVNENEPPKKPKGRKKKSLSIFEQQNEPQVFNVNAESIVVKKPRGRPKKSLSSSEQQHDCNKSQNTEISNLNEAMNDEESKEQRESSEDEENQILNNENVCQDETIQDPTMNEDDGEKESLLSNDTTNPISSDANELDAKNTVNESSIVIKKPKGGRRKSLINSEQPSLCDAIEKPIVKKRGRPKKSLSIEQQAELSNTTENSSLNDKINDEEGKKQYETGENQDLNKEDLETSQNSIVNRSDVEKKSLQSNAIANAITDELNVNALNILNGYDQITIIRKPLGRPKKSLSISERQTKDPVIPYVDTTQIVVKKPRGRPKKSLSNLEQTNSDLDGENNLKKDQAQSFNGAIDKEIKLPEMEKDNNGHKIQSSSTSLHTEDDESSILDTEVHKSSTKNSIDDKLDILRQNEEITIVKKSKGGSKKEESEIVEKKPRGRPKKADYKKNNEYKEIKHREESSQIETPNEKNKNLMDECEKEKLDSQEQGNVVAALSKETDESQTQQQSYNQVSNDEEENHVSQKDVKLNDSQTLKAQDDENKENKKKYAEKDEAETENTTPATEEQDSENSNEVDNEVPQNNTTVRKYKKFDAMNTQVIVESSKRKRKPKVLLYENEDLDISPLRKKKKGLNTSLCKIDDKTIDTKSPDKTQFNSSTHIDETEGIAETTVIKVKKVKDQLRENEKTANIDKVEHYQNVSLPNVNDDPVDTETSVSTTISSSNGKNMKCMKRQRRPKTLLYENENLKIAPKSLKKKKVEFLLPANKDSIDSDNNTEKDDSIAEGDKLEVFTNDNDELPKKKKRIKKSKILSSFAPVKNKVITSEIKKKDLMIMKKFEIKLEPIIVLERNIDLSVLKRFESDNNSLHETIHPKKPKSTLEVKKPRGRPKLSNGPVTPKSKSTSSKVLGSKHNKLKFPEKKKRPGRPSKDYSHIKILPGEPPTYQCTVCLRTFKHYTNKTLHTGCVTGVLKYKCEFCPRMFDSRNHWEYHVRSHKGDKPYRCDLCGKKFIQKGKLNRHLLIHRYTLDLECNECGKKFVSKEYLKSHLLSHVESSFVFRCNQCPKSFTQDSNRKRHELSHSPVAQFKCSQCTKSFKTKFEIKRHEKIHQNLRPFACDECDQAFLTKFELRRHSIVHTGEKKYTCNCCQQDFGRIDNYSRHMLHHHSIDPLQGCSPENTYEPTTPKEVMPETPIDEEESQRKKKDKSTVKPKKISRTSSNPMPISFIQPLTPQSAQSPSPYMISQNHDLASVIHETLPDLKNAVPVISTPISVQPSLIDPIPLEQALVLNRQIEEKIYSQSSFCEFPGLTRRVNVTLVNSSQSYDYERRNSSESNDSNDDTSYLTMNEEQFVKQQNDNQTSPAKKDIHVHWRRRTAETFKSKIDQNK